MTVYLIRHVPTDRHVGHGLKPGTPKVWWQRGYAESAITHAEGNHGRIAADYVVEAYDLTPVT